MKNPTFLALVGALALFCPAQAADSGRTPWFGGSPKAETSAIELPRTIKVALISTRNPIAIKCSGRYSYAAVKNGKPVEMSQATTLRVSGVKGGLVIGKKKFTTALQVSAIGGDSYLSINKRSYRGVLLLKPRGNGVVDVIEQVGLEDYLNGVLPREVGADWPVESLKAQAVISRTYVLANIRRSAYKGYDVTNNVFSQVYGGLQDEHPETNAAVRMTQGEILVDEKDAPVLTFFHSSCGGRTENPQYVWLNISNPPDYLDGVRDPYCRNDPFYEWSFEISADSLQRKLKRKGFRVGTVTNVKVAKESPSGRAWMMQVDSSRGRTQIQGNAFRLALGPDAFRSTLLTSVKKRGKSFRFEGHGWGHGVGLCQWGARGRALEGHSYTKILDAYYPHSRLVKTQASEPASQQARKTND